MDRNSFWIGMWVATAACGLVALTWVMLSKVCGG